MRMACVLEHMRKCVTPEAVQNKNTKIERYIGMWPIVKTEYCNAIYVKQMLLGEAVD